MVTNTAITANTMIDVYPETAPAGYITVVATSSTMTVTTTASDEDSIVFQYKFITI